MLRFIDVTGLYLAYSRIKRARRLIGLVEKCDFLLNADIGRKQLYRIQAVLIDSGRFNSNPSAVWRTGSDECGGARGLQNLLAIQVVRIGIARFSPARTRIPTPTLTAFVAVLMICSSRTME